MVWLSGRVPYEVAREMYARIGHREIPASSIWRQTRYHGSRLKAHVEQQQEHVGMERSVLPPPGQDHRQRKGVSMDGGMVNLRGEGWKEVKVGAVFDIDMRLERDPQTRELVSRAHATHQAYTALLGSADEFAPVLWALAWRHGVPTAADSCVTADGAPWIWRLTADLFPDSVQIVDWYHACEHLAGAARALHPHAEAAAQSWYRKRRKELYRGEVHKITLRLDRAGLSEQARYFHTHRRRMQYQTRVEEGYPVGSGTVESAVKQFRQRLSGPGMRWSRAGAEEMLVIRGAVIARRFDELWAAA